MEFSRENTHVYHADIGEEGGLDLDRCWKALSDAEKVRAGRFRFDLHRHRYVRAHGQIRHILAAYLNLPADSIPIETGARGKPFISAGNIYFNMSHSADTGVFVVTHSGEVGIDVEMFDRKVEVDDLSRHYYTPSEQAELASLEDSERRELFFWIWTAKEARMKVTGEGLALDPRHIDVMIDAGKPVAYRLPERPTACLARVVLPELAGACCVAGLFSPVLTVKVLGDLS